ncbi:MAG: hypothetical protein PF436_09270 [Prolixibacteraceae bacterium]|jgi:hypothetical protein|nr:hypothetical protein [Prolixibacteraceae bacterium]
MLLPWFYPNQKATILFLKDAEYYYSFDTSSTAKTDHYAFYCPGRDAHTEDEFTQTWSTQKSSFRRWLYYLKRELETPNKWDRLNTEIQSLKLNIIAEEGKFSFKEYEELKSKLHILTGQISNSNIPLNQINILNAKIDHLTDLARDMDKFDWKSLFIGSIVSIVIQLGLTQENAQLIWHFIKITFNNYFLP